MLNDYLKSDFTLLSKPGTKMGYSNLGAELLGYTLTKNTNISYEELLNSCIFSKHNMTNSTTQTNQDSLHLIPGLKMPSAKKIRTGNSPA